jgi:hypothetical protein
MEAPRPSLRFRLPPPSRSSPEVPLDVEGLDHPSKREQKRCRREKRARRTLLQPQYSMPGPEDLHSSDIPTSAPGPSPAILPSSQAPAVLSSLHTVFVGDCPDVKELTNVCEMFFVAYCSPVLMFSFQRIVSAYPTPIRATPSQNPLHDIMNSFQDSQSRVREVERLHDRQQLRVVELETEVESLRANNEVLEHQVDNYRRQTEAWKGVVDAQKSSEEGAHSNSGAIECCSASYCRVGDPTGFARFDGTGSGSLLPMSFLLRL